MEKDLYQRLGVSRDADTNEIKKAFKKQAMTHHPDKGGDAEEFKKIQQAHEILTDENKRKMYDMTGSENGEMPEGMPFGGGMQFGGGMPFDMGGIFGGLGGIFGGMGGPGPRGRDSRVRRHQPPPKTVEIPLSLKDFYHGKTIQVTFDRRKFCEACKGEGATSFQTCGSCKGNGIIRQMVSMGPIQMVNEGPCRDCNGIGKKAAGNCYVCGGSKTRPEEKKIDVKIEPGMKAGEVLVFPKECSDDPNFEEPGDFHIVLQEAAGDDGWERKGDDVETQLSLTFSESLLGCTKTLMGHPGFPEGLTIQVQCGVQHNKIVVYQEKGMVKKGSSPASYGNLHCKIHISVTDKDREILKRNEPLLKAMFA